MIVKDEEKVIGRCLNTVAHLVNEIIIVDTGSIDQTKTIARKYTKNIYDFKWTNDFSEARNFAASKATGQWILALDADEYVDEENFKEFLKELKINEGGHDTYSVKIINFSGKFGEKLVQNTHDRVYRNDGDIHYYRKIHEQLSRKSGKDLGASKRAGLTVFHSGYLNQTVSEKQKNKRNNSLIDEEIKRRSNRAFDHFNKGNEYSSIGEYEKALVEYTKAYQLKEDINFAWVPSALIQTIICLNHLKRYNDALNIISDTEILYSHSPEFPYLKADIYYQRGQLDDAKNVLQRLLLNIEHFNQVIVFPDSREQLPHKRLGDIYLLEQNYGKSMYHYSNVLNINKYDHDAIKRIVYLLSKFHNNDEIANFMVTNKMVDEQNIAVYTLACLEVGNPDLIMSLAPDLLSEKSLYYQVALLKSIFINQRADMEFSRDLFSYELIRKLNHLGFLNIVDVFLLRNYASENNEVKRILSMFEKDENLQVIIRLSEEKEVDSIDEELFVSVLQTSLVYKRYEISNLFLQKLDKLSVNGKIRVAALLYELEFKSEAMQIYQECDWDNLKANDFNNIVTLLLHSSNLDEAIKVADFAKTLYPEDFRFYKTILENTNDSVFRAKTVESAIIVFGEGMYMEKYII